MISTNKNVQEYYRLDDIFCAARCIGRFNINSKIFNFKYHYFQYTLSIGGHVLYLYHNIEKPK